MTTSPADHGLRGAVLGTGYWAEWCHATVLANHPGIEFIGVWGRDDMKTQAVAERVGGTPFATPEDLFAATDIVAVAVPPDIQAELAVRAARAGKHLLLDKPIAFTVDSAQAVVDAAASANVATLTFLTYRFQPAVVAWLDKMQKLAGDLGAWEGAEIHSFGSIDLPGSPYSGSPWRRERGGLWDWGPHALSVLDVLLPRIVGVTAVRGIRDTTTVVLEHDGGPTSVMISTCTAPEPSLESRVTVCGPAGRFELELHSFPTRRSSDLDRKSVV